MKIVTIIGARPQFIKAAAVSRVLRKTMTEILIHTGQHYDRNMSDVFFDELGIPVPDYHLGIGSCSHGAQTGAMLTEIEKVLISRKPDRVLVYGDTNSTLAGALAAAKLHLPVVHVEAGLRSFNKNMPEEINRVVTDHLSTFMFCPSQTAADNLAREGVVRGVQVVGDVMMDALLYAIARARHGTSVVSDMGLKDKHFILATVHRAENTDDPNRLAAILRALQDLAKEEPVVFPVHPRTNKAIKETHVGLESYGLRIIEPLGYLSMVQLAQSARIILTDSGGIQKEAYWLGVPCVTLRDETEWVETTQTGWNTLAGASTDAIIQAVRHSKCPALRPALYGDGHSAERVVAGLANVGQIINR
jgi:UDP-GlcNAc3NAcA epimerase